VPAPVGGLNAISSMADMPPADALLMRNWWPQPYGCSVRKGTQEWATGLTYAVNSIMTWSSMSGGAKAFAFAGANMYDISSRGAVVDPLLEGLSNSWWQSTSLVNSAGAHTIAVNGTNDAIIYDEAGLHRIVLGDGATAYTWKTLDPKDAIDVTVHQGRLWAVKKDTALAYYLEVGAIQGDMTVYDFGPLFSKGGYIADFTTWTIDDGNGATDHLVAVSSEGEAVVFQGTDPSSDTAWRLTGVYNVGAPLKGRRSYSKVGGDLVFLTQRGLISTAAMLVSTQVKDTTNLKMQKIQYLLSEAAQANQNLDGWSFHYFPGINMLMVNIPSAVEGGNIQMVSNDVVPTQPWSTFTGMDAQCWKLYNEVILYGDSTGTVWQAWVGHTDGAYMDGAPGTAIGAIAQQAYTYFGESAIQKQIDMYRLNFLVDDDSAMAFNSKISYDFSLIPVNSPNARAITRDPLWNEAIWNQDYWGTTSSVQHNTWTQALGLGYCASISVGVESSTSVIWISTDFSFKHGGLL